MKTKYLIALFLLFVAMSYAYPRLKVIKWKEQTKKEWVGPTDLVQSYSYVEYLPTGERKQLGHIYRSDVGWDASEFECGILTWHTRAYGSKELAMQAVERWCK